MGILHITEDLCPLPLKAVSSTSREDTPVAIPPELGRNAAIPNDFHFDFDFDISTSQLFEVSTTFKGKRQDFCDTCDTTN